MPKASTCGLAALALVFGQGASGLSAQTAQNLPAPARAALDSYRAGWTPENRAIGCEPKWAGWLRSTDYNRDQQSDYVVKIRSPQGSGVYAIVSGSTGYRVHVVYQSENPENQGIYVPSRGEEPRSGIRIGECESGSTFFPFTESGFQMNWSPNPEDRAYGLPPGFSEIIMVPCEQQGHGQYQGIRFDCAYETEEIDGFRYTVFNNWDGYSSSFADHKSMIGIKLGSTQVDPIGVLNARSGFEVVRGPDGRAYVLAVNLWDTKKPYAIYQITSTPKSDGVISRSLVPYVGQASRSPRSDQGEPTTQFEAPRSGFWKRTNVSYPADQSPIIDVRFEVRNGRSYIYTSYTLNNGVRVRGQGSSDDGQTFLVKENGFDVFYHFESAGYGTGQYNNTRGGTDNFVMVRM